MNQRAVEEFYDRDCIPVLAELYRNIKNEIKSRETEIKEQWLEDFDRACKKMAQFQEKNGLEAVAHIQFTYLRTRLLQKDYRYAIYAYGKDWYGGRETSAGNLNVSMFFVPFEEGWRNLEKESLKYIGKVTKTDVERLMLEESGRILLFTVSLLRKWRREFLQTEGFKMLKKESRFQIQAGEYYEPGYVLHTRMEEKEEENIKKALRKQKSHCGHDLRHMKLDGMNFADMEFMDADFTGSSLRNCTFDSCILQGAVMDRAVLAGAVFTGCTMEESEWRESDLRDARFEECLFYAGEKLYAGPFLPDYGKTEFRDCRMEEAGFIRCAMNGTDFTKTDVSGCKFTGSSLAGCRFGREQAEQLELSEIQQGQAEVEG